MLKPPTCPRHFSPSNDKVQSALIEVLQIAQANQLLTSTFKVLEVIGMVHIAGEVGIFVVNRISGGTAQPDLITRVLRWLLPHGLSNVEILDTDIYRRLKHHNAKSQQKTGLARMNRARSRRQADVRGLGTAPSLGVAI